MKSTPTKGSQHPKNEPEAPIVKVEGDAAGEIPVPSWPDTEAPPAIRVYNFAVRRLMALSLLCPDPEVQAAAARFLCAEFSPAKPAAASVTEAELILRLRQAIAAETPEEDLALESESYGAGTKPALPVPNSKEPHRR
jgi:hypothetical protein